MGNFKTPLRYPGGKQKLTPFVKEIIEINDFHQGHYVEPYAGGAGVAMDLLLTNTVSHIHLNDSCKGVYSFWKSILNHTDEFCSRIFSASLNVKEWRRQKEIFVNQDEHDLLDLGFSMFYLNRCNRSGILSGGLIGGLSQKGEWKMDARFPRAELIKRIEAIAQRKRFIHLRNWDAERFVVDYLPRLPKNSLVYFDPPYFHKADRLYRNHYKPFDHERISRTIQREVKLPWMVSYDSAPEIMSYYSKRRAFVYDLQYSAARSYKGNEAFFFSDKLKIPQESSLLSVNLGLENLSRGHDGPGEIRI